MSERRIEVGGDDVHIVTRIRHDAHEPRQRRRGVVGRIGFAQGDDTLGDAEAGVAGREQLVRRGDQLVRGPHLVPTQREAACEADEGVVGERSSERDEMGLDVIHLRTKVVERPAVEVGGPELAGLRDHPAGGVTSRPHIADERAIPDRAKDRRDDHQGHDDEHDDGHHPPARAGTPLR